MNGFLNLNKPFGITSHDCVAKVRHLLRMKKVGHGGTLDPAATGVLPIALGKATRLLQFLREDKVYKATIRLGINTTTDDLQGEIISTQSAAELSLEDVQVLLPQFIGKIQQIPPNYSAISVQGKRLYDLARAGEIIDVPARSVEIYEIEILDWRHGNFAELDVKIACGGGTYIRAIARDLGVKLQIGGTLAALIRTESCGFQLTDSVTFEELETKLEQKMFEPINVVDSLAHLPKIILPVIEAKKWCQGQKISDFVQPTQNSESKIRVHSEKGTFLGIGEIIKSSDVNLLIPLMVFEPI